MTKIWKNTDLNDGKVNTLDGWETSSASAFNVVIYTANEFAAYSDDYGTTFHAMDLAGLCKAWGETDQGDQVVIYIPQITQFAWVILTSAQNLILALSSPREIEESKGRAWTTWLVPAKQFDDGRSIFDQPVVAVGDNFLYITCNLGPKAIALRLSLAELYRRGPVNFTYFVATPGAFWMKPALSTGDTGYFAVLMATFTDVRVFSWPERSHTITWRDYKISLIPTDDGVVEYPRVNGSETRKVVFRFSV